MSASSKGDRSVTAMPTMLDLLRLSRRPLFTPGGKELYRRIALLTDAYEGDDLLVAACGRGTTLAYFVREFAVQGSGVDESPEMVEEAERQAREEGIHGGVSFQSGSMAELPYRDGVFDIAVGELALTANVPPQVAISELVRVLRPGGRLALVHLVWKAPIEEQRRAELAAHLGVRPMMLVEVKRVLRDLGVEGLHTEGWSGEGSGLRSLEGKPFPDFAELFSLREKLGILRRALAGWGLPGVGILLAREREIHHLLSRERILGLTLTVGRRLPAAPAREKDVRPETDDLPLFLQGDRR